MRKILLFGVTLVAIILAGCGGMNRPVAVKPTPQQILQPTIDLINYCSKDTGLNTMAYKAYFDTAATALVVYLGKTPSHNQYMWSIPLQIIDKSSLNLFRQDYNISSITLSTYGAKKGIKYYMDNKFKSNSAQFILYLGKCFGSKEKDEVLERLTQAITASQENLPVKGTDAVKDSLSNHPTPNIQEGAETK